MTITGRESYEHMELCLRQWQERLRFDGAGSRHACTIYRTMIYRQVTEVGSRSHPADGHYEPTAQAS